VLIEQWTGRGVDGAPSDCARPNSDSVANKRSRTHRQRLRSSMKVTEAKVFDLLGLTTMFRTREPGKIHVAGENDGPVPEASVFRQHLFLRRPR